MLPLPAKSFVPGCSRVTGKLPLTSLNSKKHPTGSEASKKMHNVFDRFLDILIDLIISY
jgi:hypothetical protein